MRKIKGFLAAFLLGIVSTILFQIPSVAAEIPSDAVIFEGHNYKMYELELTWSEAEEYCESLGGHLMTVTSADEQALLVKLGGEKGHNYWLGGTDKKVEGTWEWVTGETWDYTCWNSGQPDNSQEATGNQENYLQACYDWNMNWNDSSNEQDSTAKIGFICEWDSLSNVKISSLKNTSKGIKIKWSRLSSASGYYVYRKTTSGGYKKIKTIKSATTVSYTDTSVKSSKNGTIYTYKIVPYSSYNTKGTGTGKTIARLSGTSLTNVKSSKSKKITVAWKKKSGVSGYQIQYSTNKNFTSNIKTKKVAGTSKKRYTRSGLKSGKTYYVRIRTYKTVSGKTYYSAWSNKKSVKTS
ncbi:MAG: fibronectin type III domain-containing protein [Clostridiales bacterium]|nr:fibronectin type III domain-containing protein [Clostridiales bacterium]